MVALPVRHMAPNGQPPPQTPKNWRGDCLLLAAPPPAENKTQEGQLHARVFSSLGAGQSWGGRSTLGPSR